MNTLGYLGALGATPTQATQAASTIRQYTDRLSGFVQDYGAYRVDQAGYPDSLGGTFRADGSTMTVLFPASYTLAVRAAWKTIQDYAEAHGQQRMRLPTDYATIANALPDLRAALTAVAAWVRADLAEASRAEADRIASTQYPSGTAPAPIRLPTMYVTSKPPVAKAVMSTAGKVMIGTGIAALAWLMFRKKRG